MISNINFEFEHDKLNLLHTTLVIYVNTSKEIIDDNLWAKECGGPQNVGPCPAAHSAHS